MAYESMTYESILSQMLTAVSNSYPNLDTREGSIMFNALAPVAIELAIAYASLDNNLNESFVNTATREYIITACQQMGMDTSVFFASNGEHKAYFNVEVPIYSRWNHDLYNYTVTEYLGEENGYYAYRMFCETLGSEPNNTTGDLTAIDSIPTGLTYASLVECLIEGENETDDDDVRTAYYEFVNSSFTDGNVDQYKRWCDEYPSGGIGNHKIIPLWNGANTVKVSILSSSNRAASNELIEEFQNYLDPGITGMGDGEAPIGAFVTVSTATEIPIEISANITLKAGYTDTKLIDSALSSYFSSIAYVENETIINYMAIGSAIINCECVKSVTNVLVNGDTSDITLGTEEIPIVGTTNWTVT